MESQEALLKEGLKLRNEIEQESTTATNRPLIMNVLGIRNEMNQGSEHIEVLVPETETLKHLSFAIMSLILRIARHRKKLSYYS